jgi:hypothetical protein
VPTFFIFPMAITDPTCLILDLISFIIFGEGYKLWYFHYVIFSILKFFPRSQVQIG